MSDTVTAAAGIAVSTRSEFNPQPFSGTTRVVRSSLRRTGGYEPNGQTAFGAFWIFASQSAISSVSVQELEILDSSYQGLLLSGEQAIQGCRFEGVSISNAASFGIEIASADDATFERERLERNFLGARASLRISASPNRPATSGW